MNSTHRIWLALPVLALLVLAAWHPWSTAWNVDERTQLEMIDGVVTHGVPKVESPLLSVLGENRMRFLVPHGGAYWGQYPPAYAYLSAPWYWLGGARGVISANFFYLAILFLVTYRLARDVVHRPWVAVLCAWSVLIATGIMGHATLPSPFALATTLALLATWLALGQGGPSRFRLMLSGLCAGLAFGCHYLALPVALVLAWAVAGTRRDPDLDHWQFPVDTSGLARLLLFGSGPVLVVCVMSVLNHHRFGSWAPVTYGAGTLITVGSALAAFVALGLVLLYGSAPMAWRRRGRYLMVAGLFVGFATSEVLRDFGLIFLGCLVDKNIAFSGDTFLDAPRPVLALLQESPVVVMALFWFTPYAAGSKRQQVTMRLLVALGLSTICLAAARGVGSEGAFRLGSPYLHLRYNFIALPLLAIPAISAFSLFVHRTRTLLAATVVTSGCAVLTFALWTTDDRLATLARTSNLVIVVLAFALPWLMYRAGRSGQSALRVTGAALLLASAFTTGVYAVPNAWQQTLQLSANADVVDRLLPQGALVIIGPDAAISGVTGLKHSRDMVTLSTAEPRMLLGEHALRMFRAWGDPIYLYYESAIQQNAFPQADDQPDLRHWELVDEAVRLYRLRHKRTPGPRRYEKPLP